MRILFCRPNAPQAIEDRFDLEVDALDELGVRHDTIAMERVVDDELDRAFDGLRSFDDEVLYRGWMLTAEEYASLDAAVSERGGELVTSPDDYEAAHYLPNWHAAVSTVTPATRWITGVDLDEAWEAAAELGPPPYVVKDHVKSVKEQWDEACFVPEGAGRAEFDAICRALIDARGERFERGLVIRRFVPLASAPGAGERGECDEHRLFFWRGRLIASAPYDDVPGTDDVPERLAALGRALDVPLFSADVARTRTGEWLVIELGDGGVSTLPPTMDPRVFYRAIV